ncbi:MAG: transporter [Candidatus Manganitrophaceae bacterium]
MKNKEQKIILFFFLSLFVSLFFVDAVFAERPFLLTERGTPVEKGNYRLETGLLFNRFSSDTKTTSLAIDVRYGLIQNLEVSLLIPYLFRKEGGEHDNQIGDLLFRGKVRFLKGREANPLSISGQVIIKLPTAKRDPFFDTTGEADIGFFGIASKEFAPITAHLNLGYVYIGNPPFAEVQDQLRYGLALELQTVEEALFLTTELSGFTSVGKGASKNDILNLMGGIVYRIDRAFRIDASGGIGLTQDSPDYLINTGLTYLFP